MSLWNDGDSLTYEKIKIIIYESDTKKILNRIYISPQNLIDCIMGTAGVDIKMEIVDEG